MSLSANTDDERVSHSDILGENRIKSAKNKTATARTPRDLSPRGTQSVMITLFSLISGNNARYRSTWFCRSGTGFAPVSPTPLCKVRVRKMTKCKTGDIEWGRQQANEVPRNTPNEGGEGHGSCHDVQKVPNSLIHCSHCNLIVRPKFGDGDADGGSIQTNALMMSAMSAERSPPPTTLPLLCCELSISQMRHCGLDAFSP
jgi:hypothetical protein